MRHWLKKKAATDRYHELSQRIKDIEKRMEEITELKKNIMYYSNTKKVFFAYVESDYSKKYYEEYFGEISIHKRAKAAFNDLKDGKIPSVKVLNAEFTGLLDKKKIIYSD